MKSVLWLFLLTGAALHATGAEAGLESVKALTKRLMPSLVVVHTLDVAGDVETSGTGFVVDESGIIATSLHTIPQGRRIEVVFQDERRFPVEAVEAFDGPTDLALLKVAATNLPALPLGNSDTLEQGEPVIAIGHPQGHNFSVVEGVVSARRDIELEDMIQLALPTEQGNSGGPVLDRHGVVYGVLAMKHAFRHNVGFAVPINALKPLIESPNPIPMRRWATIGQLNGREWKTVFGARWSQSGGQILVSTAGKGFGGRSLCLSQHAVPELPYEVAVSVKLDDESGAAGLTFESDGSDVHYGFYPTGGNLRLTRFNGPSVWTWTIIETVPSEHYRPGDWNRLKVRVTKESIQCFVNEQLVIESDDVELRNGGQAGLCKFRHTKAEFKGFAVARRIPSTTIAKGVEKKIVADLGDLNPDTFPADTIVDSLMAHGPAAQTVLEKQARHLEKQAEQLRRLAGWVHTKKVEADLVKELGREESQIDLLYCALLLAKNDDPELDVEAYRRLVDAMAEELSERMAKNASELEKLQHLNGYLFEENGFHGSRVGYYGRNNSYINRVLDDREGQPITLSVVYLELARRIGITSLVGANIPRHFMVYHNPAAGDGRLIDVYEKGRVLDGPETRLVAGGSEPPVASKREIVARILRNLLNGTESGDAGDSSARYYELLVEVTPDSDFARVQRALARWQAGNVDGARSDLVWLLEHDSPDVNQRRVRELLLDLDKR